MATMIALNLVASIAVATALGAVCRFAFTAVDGWVDDRTATVESAPRHELERRAA
jgi:hypothetical protein